MASASITSQIPTATSSNIPTVSSIPRIRSSMSDILAVGVLEAAGKVDGILVRGLLSDGRLDGVPILLVDALQVHLAVQLVAPMGSQHKRMLLSKKTTRITAPIRELCAFSLIFTPLNFLIQPYPHRYLKRMFM